MIADAPLGETARTSPALDAVDQAVIVAGDGDLLGIIGVSEDITERRWSEESRRRDGQRLHLALGAAHLGVWEWDRLTGVVEWDARLEALFGLEEGTFDGTFEAYGVLLHPDDAARVLAIVEQAVATGTDFTVEHRIIRPDGGIRWVQGQGQPVRSDGRITGLIGVLRDVTEHHDAEDKRARLLAKESADQAAQQYQAALLGSLFEASIDGILAVDSQGAVLAHNQRFLELWGLEPALIDEGDHALLVAAMEKVPDGEAFIEGVLAAYEQRSAHIQDELTLVDGTVLDRHGTRLDDADGTFLGFAWSFRDVTAERAHQAEIAAAGERFAALARTLQQSLLPPRLPSPPGIQLAARYHPAIDGIDVGGDFYDVFAVGVDWVLVIGDVCGKGAEAASITALVRHTVRAAAMHDPDPAVVLAELNDVMLAGHIPKDDVVRFATVSCIRLRPSPEGVVADIACGGHPPPVILRADGSREVGAHNGTLIGVLDVVDIRTRSSLLHPGDSIVAVTDGVLEARDAAGRFFGDAGLDAILASCGGRDATAISEAVEQHVRSFQGGVARDDIAILVARIDGLS